MVQDDTVDLPGSIDDGSGLPDYENPLQASPIGRPHTGTLNITKSQVSGESPEDWRKANTVEFVRRIAVALEHRLAAHRRPVVLIADAEIQGHFQKLSDLGSLLTGVVETDPETLDVNSLHAAAYDVVRPMLDMDSSVSETLGVQDGSAYNGHFGCICFHPLFVFNQFGDLERCSLRSRNVHSVADWRGVLEPVVARYRHAMKRRHFRGDAACASPAIYELLEEEGSKYTIRLPINAVLQERIGWLPEASGGTASACGAALLGDAQQ